MEIAAVEDLFHSILNEVSVRMAEAFERAGEFSVEHPLSQAGLVEGNSIVLEYLGDNEAQIALEHLLYMVNEPPLELSEMAEAGLLKLCALYGVQRKH